VKTSAAARAASTVRFERTYEAPIEDLWDLWTTKDGFEAWWGPEGFRVEVHRIEPRPGGALVYDMIAIDPEHIAFLEKEGMPTSHGTRAVFVEVAPPRRLMLRNTIDFIPGHAPYDNDFVIELFEEGPRVRMVVTIEAHPDPEWTQRATAGFESQLTKLPAALAALHA